MRGWPFLLLMLLAITTVFATPTEAQSQPAPVGVADTLRLGLAGLGNAAWLTGQNAAALPHWQSRGYGLTRLTGYQTAGPLRRPQEPVRHQSVGLHTEGMRPVGGWWVFGEFDYRKTADTQLAFSHGYDPFNGNPYLWADTLTGDWTRDHIRARVALTTPVRGRWRLGLALPYHVGQGSRLLDPKPFYRFRDVGVLPSVWRQVSARWGWGLVLGGQFTQEENEVGFFTVRTDNPLLYRMRGYGSFSQSPIVSAERLVRGTTWLATAQTEWKTGAASWGAQVGGRLRHETIREGIAAPQAGGVFREAAAHARLSRVQPRPGGGWRLAAQTDLRQGRGTDPILSSIGPTYLLTTTRLDYDHWRLTNERFRHETTYLMAETMQYSDPIVRTDWSALRLMLGVEVLRRWGTAGNGTGWFGRLGLGVRYVPTRSFVALRPTRLTTLLTRPDYVIQTTSAGLLGGSIGRDFRLNNFPKLLHRLEVRADGQFTAKAGQRSHIYLTYSLLYL